MVTSLIPDALSLNLGRLGAHPFSGTGWDCDAGRLLRDVKVLHSPKSSEKEKQKELWKKGKGRRRTRRGETREKDI